MNETNMITGNQIPSHHQPYPHVESRGGEIFSINYRPSDPIKSRYNRMVCLLTISVIVAMISILWVTYLWIKSNEIKAQLKANSIVDVGRQLIGDFSSSSHNNQNSSSEKQFDLKSLFNIAKDAVKKFNETIHSATKDN